MRHFLVVCVAAGVLAGCTRGSESVTIAAAGPWQEWYGRMDSLGVELAVEQINERGGVRGRPLRVVMRDDEADGVRAAGIAEEFVSTPEIVAVVGHVNSGAMVAAAKIYDGRLPAVATTATSPDLTGISPWVFRVVSSDSANGRELARFAARRGRTRAAILYENDSYGRGLADAFRRNFNGQIVGMDPIPSGASDLEPFVTWYKRQRPDVVFVAGTDASGVAFLREARRQQLDADFLGGDGWSGVTSDTVASEGAYIGVPFTPTDPRPEVRAFVKAFETRYRQLPDGNAALAYDATMAVAQAIEEAGPSRKAVRDYLANIGASDAYRGVTRPIRFREDGDPMGAGFVVTRVRRGVLVVEDGV